MAPWIVLLNKINYDLISASLRSLEILPQVIFEVKYTFVEGVLRISDMWIKRN